MTRSYENHGFIRDYVTRVDGDIWTFTGDTERARVEFANGGDAQKISWEWRKPGEVGSRFAIALRPASNNPTFFFAASMKITRSDS